eukprot:1157884-Pelagomonas_calceolata.AAC.6
MSALAYVHEPHGVAHAVRIAVAPAGTVFVLLGFKCAPLMVSIVCCFVACCACLPPPLHVHTCVSHLVSQRIASLRLAKSAHLLRTWCMFSARMSVCTM